MQSVELRIQDYLARHVREWFPEAPADEAPVEMIGRRVHSNSVLFRFRLRAAPFARLVVKLPAAHQPRRHAEQTAPALKFRAEFDALRRIHEHFQGLGDPGFCAIRPLGFMEDELGIVSEEIRGRSLRGLLAGATRLHRKASRARVERLLTTAGAWLRAFHALPPPANGQPAGSIEGWHHDFEAKAELLMKAGAAPREIVTALEAMRSELAGGGLLSAVKHGDFAPRNILVTPAGQVAGLDTQARLLAPVFEDIGYFLLQLETSKLQMFSRGFLFSQRALADFRRGFLAGYFRGEGVSERLLTLFQLKAAIDKWAQRLLRIEAGQSNLRFLSPSVERRLVNGFFQRYILQLLQRADSSAPLTAPEAGVSCIEEGE